MKLKIGSKTGTPISRAWNPLIFAGASVVTLLTAVAVCVLGAFILLMTPFSIFFTIKKVKEYT